MLVHLPKLRRDEVAGRSHFKKFLIITGIIMLLATSLLYMTGVRNVLFPSTQSPLGSWNSAVACSPTILTMEQILGAIPNPNQHSPNQGADYSGGKLLLSGVTPPGVSPTSSSWPFSKRSTHPPCGVVTPGGITMTTFVEVHNVMVLSISYDECGSIFPGVCDETFNICNNVLAPTCATTYPSTMHKIHSEIDMNWIHASVAPKTPTSGSIIDIQGFVFWDDGHLNASWHNYSGWEIHPVTAWRPAVHPPALTPPSNTPVQIVSGETLPAILSITIFKQAARVLVTGIANDVFTNSAKPVSPYSHG